jgi:hypothetical protein
MKLSRTCQSVANAGRHRKREGEEWMERNPQRIETRQRTNEPRSAPDRETKQRGREGGEERSGAERRKRREEGKREHESQKGE